jgi:hypothetical protein
MQKAEVVLSVLRERGGKGLPLTQLYRQTFSKNLYLLAYGNVYSNQGAMTQCHGLWVFDRLWVVPVLVTAGSSLPAGMPEGGASRRGGRVHGPVGASAGRVTVLSLVRLGRWPW